VPEELRELPGWLLWRYEVYAGESKARKVPFWADGNRRYGEQGGPLDRSRLVTFAAARDAALAAATQGRQYDGLGFAPMADFGYTFLDFDNCADGYGNLPAEIMDIVGRTYCEYSPSGTGVRAVLKGDLGNRKSHATAGQFGFETFSSKGFVTFTGYVLPICRLLGYENHIAEVDDNTRRFAETRFGRLDQSVPSDDFMAGREPPLGLSVAEMQNLLSYLDPSMRRDPWLRVGMALHHETQGSEIGFDLWDSWSSAGMQYQGTDDLRYQWERFEQRPGRPSTTMRSVIHMAKQNGYEARKTVSPEDVSERVETTEPRGVFKPRTLVELERQKPPEWLIKGVMPKGELGVIFGASGSGKTFVVLDLAFAIARGIDWRGKRTKKGRVVIIAAEGGGAFAIRAKAYAKYHGLRLDEIPDIFVITAAPNFLEGDDIADIIAEIRALGNIDAIVIDTLAQVSPGANENTSEDMGRLLANVRTLHNLTGATPYLVHHAGKDLSRGSRGWSGLKAAADVQIEVLRHDDGRREIVIEKMKDGEDGLRWPFKLEVVDLGIDEDGDPITSCVAVEADPAPPPVLEAKGAKKRGVIERHVLEVIELFPKQDVIPLAALVERAVETLPPVENGRRDTRRQRVIRALDNMSREKDGPLRVKGGQVILYE
jgi:hypothetical protein